MKFATNRSSINEGKGYSLEELEDIIVQAHEGKESLNDEDVASKGDLAISLIIIKELIDYIKSIN